MALDGTTLIVGQPGNFGQANNRNGRIFGYEWTIGSPLSAPVIHTSANVDPVNGAAFGASLVIEETRVVVATSPPMLSSSRT